MKVELPSDIQVAVGVERGRESYFTIKGRFSELNKLSQQLSKAIETSISESKLDSFVYSCIALPSSGKGTETYLVFQVDNDAVSLAQRASRGLRGVWNDAGGCFVQCALVALAVKGVISFFG